MERGRWWLAVVALLLGVTGVAVFGRQATGEFFPSEPIGVPFPEHQPTTEAMAGILSEAALTETPRRTPLLDRFPEQVPVPQGVLQGRVVDTGALGMAGVEMLLVASNPARGGRRGGQAPAGVVSRIEAVQSMQVQVEARLRASGARIDQPQLDRIRGRIGLDVRARTVTDAEGFYRFQKPESSGKEIGLAVQAALPSGYLPGEPIVIVPMHLKTGRLPDILLVRSATIRGLVQGLHGGRSQIEVLAWRLGEAEQLEKRTHRIAPDRSAGPWATPGGLFVLEPLAPGTWRLALHQRGEVDAFQWGPVIDLAEGETREGVSLALAPDCALELFLLGPGRSLLEAPAQVSLSLHRLGPQGERGQEIVVNQTLSTAHPPSGQPFLFQNLSPGLYRVQAALIGLARRDPDSADFRVTREVELVRGLQRVELLFPEVPLLGSLELRVTGANGAPVSGARVTLTAQASGRGGASTVPGGNRSLQTDARGVAFFRGLTPSRFRVSVWARDYLGGNLSLDMAREVEGAHVERELALRRAASLRGRVVDTSGQGVPAARVRLSQSAQSGAGQNRNVSSRILVADREGRFQLTNLQPGRYEIAVDDGESPSSRQTVRLVPGRTNTVTLKGRTRT